MYWTKLYHWQKTYLPYEIIDYDHLSPWPGIYAPEPRWVDPCPWLYSWLFHAGGLGLEFVRSVESGWSKMTDDWPKSSIFWFKSVCVCKSSLTWSFCCMVCESERILGRDKGIWSIIHWFFVQEKNLFWTFYRNKKSNLYNFRNKIS